MQQTVKDRREKVSYYLIKGTSEKEIAIILKVSRQTVVRDVAFLKKFSQRWLDDLAKNGFIFEYKMTLEKIKTNGVELQKLYKDTDDIEQKIMLLRESDRNSKLYLEMLGETPTIHAFKKATRRGENTDVSSS